MTIFPKRKVYAMRVSQVSIAFMNLYLGGLLHEKKFWFACGLNRANKMAEGVYRFNKGLVIIQEY